MDRCIATMGERKGRSANGLYTTKIIKAGALLADTKALLSNWDLSASVKENLRRLQRDNLFGKASRSRVVDILAIFRQRFLGDLSVTRALIAMVGHRSLASALDRLLYFHAAQADCLLRDVVTEVLLPQQARGGTDVNTDELDRTLRKWVSEGKTTTAWGDQTIRRVTQGLLSTLRDFGVLQGASKKRISPNYLPIEAFAYIAFLLNQQQPSGAKLIELPAWKLYFVSRESVERFLLEAHQRDLLEYHAAGSVTRLTFPAKTLVEYVHVLAERAH